MNTCMSHEVLKYISTHKMQILSAYTPKAVVCSTIEVVDISQIFTNILFMLNRASSKKPTDISKTS